MALSLLFIALSLANDSRALAAVTYLGRGEHLLRAPSRAMVHSTSLLLVFLPFNSAFSLSVSAGILPTPRDGRRSRVAPSPTARNGYSKGSEIWPECNEEPIRLAASFPGGVVPRPAQALLDAAAAPSAAASSSRSESQTSAVDLSQTPVVPTRGTKRRAVRQTLSHLLQSAAQASNRRARSTTVEGTPAIDKGPAVLALLLVLARCVAFKYVAVVVGMSAYFVGLASWCAALKYSSTDQQPIVNMPALPVHGHVPSLVANPLGASLINSRVYRNWLRAGALLGVLLPTAILAKWVLGSMFPAISTMAEWMNTSNVGAAKRIVGGPLFLLCFQALTEAVARTALLPLPVRILIPIAYNTLRLSSLQPWALANAQAAMPSSLRVLGMANLVYWQANLLFFLVPVGVVRYLRAHFLCVEAVEVTVRIGSEDSVGLLP